MLNKSSLELSKVQNKVLEELELLTDAFVSTFNEIGDIMKPFSDELNALLENFLKQKNNWRFYTSKCFDLSYRPFTDYTEERKFSIGILKNNFYAFGQKVLIKEVEIEGKKKEVDALSLDWGFSFNKEDRLNHFSVSISRSGTLSEITFSKKEYEEILNQIKITMAFNDDSFYDLQHPEEDDDAEFIQLWLDYREINKLHKLFQIYQKEFFEPFLLKIND